MNHIILGVVLIAAAAYDSRQNRIPNSLCIAALAAGVCFLLFQGSMKEGLMHLLWGAGLFLFLFPLWIMRAVGGGDVKLFLTAGFLLGGDSMPFIICAGMCTGMHAFLLMIGRKNYFKRMKQLMEYVLECFVQKKWKPYPFDCKTDYKDGGIRISYGLLAGHILAWALGMHF